ncbi:T9SS type A sorting domain-containing protein [Dyadobacter psychrophilus]|uniref:T9SS type A sorting domain-containing protein n=1 Tax=Dyadobacter psychrophilus TaxID=651661 RepID=UPI001483C671|nr:T9SS type A sorting domain-containing protein [Dyadobacter psychrophilus]
MDDLIFFEGFDNNLWRSDGTEQGTYSINSNPTKVLAEYTMYPFQGKLYFTRALPSKHSGGATIFDNKIGLSDGSPTGTILLGDFKTPLGNSRPRYKFMESDGQLRFWSLDDGNAVHRVGTSPEETRFERRLINSPADHFNVFYAHGMYYAPYNLMGGFQVIRESDWASFQLKALKPSSFLEFGNLMLFSGATQNGDKTYHNELWQSDGTEQGTSISQVFPAKSRIEQIGKLNDNLIIFCQAELAADLASFEIWLGNGAPGSAKKTISVSYEGFNAYIGWELLKGEDKFYALSNGINQKAAKSVIQSDGTSAGTKLFNFPYADSIRQTYLLDDELHFLTSVRGDKSHQKIYALTKEGQFVQKYEQRESDIGMAIDFLVPYKNGKTYIYSTTFTPLNSSKNGIGELWKMNFCPQAVNVTSNTDFALCQGSSSELVANVTGGSGNYSYKWSTGNTANKIIVDKAGDYSVTVADGKGCEVSSTVKVVSGGGLKIAVEGPVSMCSGQTATLSATVSGGSGTYTYQWLSNGTAVAGATTKTYSANKAGTYSVKVADTKGCSAVSDTRTLKEVNESTVKIVSSTGTNVFIPGKMLMLSIIPSPGQTYQWRRNSQDIIGAVTNSYVVKEEGSYTITVTSNGCTFVSTPFIISVILAAEPSLNVGYQVAIFPNPTNSTARALFTLPKPMKARVCIYDINGRKMSQISSSVKLMNHDLSLDLSSLPAGTYIVKMKALDTEKEIATRIIKR